MTTLSRRALAALAAGALLTPLSALPPAQASVSTERPAAAVAKPRVTKPSKPIVTKVSGGQYARIDFRVAKTGGQRWTRIEARGLQYKNGKVVGSCHPPTIKSSGRYVGFNPGGPGQWTFQVRVKNSAGWSAWSSSTKQVRVR